MAFPEFVQLTAEQKQLLGNRSRYDALEDKLKAGFLNITSALAWLGISTQCLQLKPQDGPENKRGIQQDRLLFEPCGIEALQKTLKDRIDNKARYGDKGFVNDRPNCKEHEGMCKWGGRQWVTSASVQIGGGDGGAFVDIDEFGVKTDVAGFFGHAFEVIRNKVKHVKTDPYLIGRKLSQRFALPYSYP